MAAKGFCKYSVTGYDYFHAIGINGRTLDTVVYGDIVLTYVER